MLNAFIKGYESLILFGSILKSPILFICRLYWGWLFAQSGLSKLLDIETFAQFLTELHFYYPHFHAYLAAGTEFFGGVCLVLGFASRLAAIPLAITMLTAYLTAHYEAVTAIFYEPSRFVAEAPFNFLLVSLLVFAFGPGRISIDYFLEKYVFKKA